MIVIAGTIHIHPTNKEEALAAMKAMQEASQNEEGCLTYHFYLNPWDDSQVFLFEEWESSEALQAHGQTPHIKTWRKQIAIHGTGERHLQRYEVSEVNDL